MHPVQSQREDRAEGQAGVNSAKRTRGVTDSTALACDGSGSDALDLARKASRRRSVEAALCVKQTRGNVKMPPRSTGGALREVVRPPATAHEEGTRPARPSRCAPDLTLGGVVCRAASAYCLQRRLCDRPIWLAFARRAVGRHEQPVSWCRGGRFLPPGEVTGNCLPPMHRRVAPCASLSGPAAYGNRKAVSMRPRPPLAATTHTCLTATVRSC